MRTGFHARDGWYFRRNADGSVTIEIAESAQAAAALVDAAAFDADTWASIVASVSAHGENSGTFYAAQNLHAGEPVEGGTPMTDPYTAEARLCDDTGLVSDERVTPGAPGTILDPELTYRKLLNNLRGHTGLPAWTGEPFACTGSAHLAAEHFRCTNPIHVAQSSIVHYPAPLTTAAIPSATWTMPNTTTTMTAWWGRCPECQVPFNSHRLGCSALAGQPFTARFS